MSRLYGAKLNTNEWIINEIDNKNYHTYKLTDKNDNNYYLNHIIGFEQVTDDEFLVFRRASYDDFEIIRYKLHNLKLIEVFSKRFSQFEFITDDRILFAYWGNAGPYLTTGIYSIRDNTMLNNANWLNDTVIDIYDDDETNETKLYVVKDLFSYKLGNQKIIFMVDPNTLEPDSDCYSQLRDSFIKVDSKEDIQKIISEDKKYINIIESHIDEQNKEQIKKAKERLLKK